ncbi:EF-hand, partial [Violaceomyces palustris]
MQSPSPAQGSTITLSPIERPAFAYLFQLADPLKSGIVTGDDAVKFFEKSGLPRATLGQIWSIADSANNGFLTPPSFSIALRLISHAQKGEQVTEAIAKSPSNPPTFEGITLPLVSQSTGPSTNPLGVMEIKPEDRARYTRIFVNAGPQGGLIDGEKAKEIFVKSKLPFDKLGAIWNLADTQARGSLDLTDFIIGMHFIQNTMNGSLNSIPAVLPAGLYEQAKGGPSSSTFRAFAPPIGHPSSPIAAQTTGGSAGGIQRQFTGPAVSRTFSPPPPLQNVSVFRSPPPPVNPGKNSAWDVTADEKTRSDRFFDGLDTENKGVLEGSAVVPFFMQSKLSESVLAHVWDLSDITQSGTLSRDEFAVAMHLINGQLAGKELPQELPQSLVPPSMRGMNLPEAVNPQQSDTQKDLFSLMDDDTPPLPISAASAFIAPSSTLSRQTVTSPAAAPAAQAPKSSGPFDDDFFGESSSTPQKASFAVTPMLTGGSSSGAGVKSPQVPGTPSLSATQPLNDQSADFGNKSIQLQSTSKAVADLQTKRTGLEAAVTQGAASIAEIETRLATVRSQHESETKLVKDLETRHQTQSDELKKLREDVIREESSLSALKAEKDELEQSVMRDREDIRDLKKRMNEVQQETKMLKESLEKLKKEARQQKGLVAIGKKQLGTAESERE